MKMEARFGFRNCNGASVGEIPLRKREKESYCADNT